MADANQRVLVDELMSLQLPRSLDDCFEYILKTYPDLSYFDVSMASTEWASRRAVAVDAVDSQDAVWAAMAADIAA